MGTCYTKLGNTVIKPVKTKNPTQPGFLHTDEKKNSPAENKPYDRSRKDIDEASIKIKSISSCNSRNYLMSTHDQLGDTLKPPSINFMTKENEGEASQLFWDTLGRKSANYKKGPLIGKGPSGEVYECLNLNTGELVAVKEITLHGNMSKMLPYFEALKKENTQFRALSHPNIMRYYETEIMETKDDLLIVGIAVEYVSGGSIKALLDKFQNLEEKVVMSYTRQILEGLSYLHKNGIVHKNIKGTNILIDASGTIKLSDFGSFKFEDFSEDNSQDTHKVPPSMRPSLFWLAPEVVMRKAQGKPADIWSVGCIVIEMLTGIPPWKSLRRTSDETAGLITSGTPPPFPHDVSESCRDFIHKVFKFKPDDRPTVADLLEHPFVKEPSPNNSYYDSEMLQSSMYGRIDSLRNNSNIEKYSVTKSGDLRGQYGAGVLNTSSIYASRIVSRAYPSDYVLANGIKRTQSIEFIPVNKSEVQEKEGDAGRLPTLNKVQELPIEDEITPSMTDKQFFPPSSNNKLIGSLDSVDKGKPTEQDIEKVKAELRRKIEEEMMRDLDQASIDHTKDIFETEEGMGTESKEDSKAIFNLEREKSGGLDKKQKGVPSQNSLFVKNLSGDLRKMGSSEDQDSKAMDGSPVEGARTLEDEIAGRMNEMKQSNSIALWRWSKENEKETNEVEPEKIREKQEEKDMTEQISIAENDEPLNKEPEEISSRQKNRNKLLRTNLQGKEIAKLHTEESHDSEDNPQDNITHILDVEDDEGGIHRREIPIRVENIFQKKEINSGRDDKKLMEDSEPELIAIIEETEENKEESREYGKKRLEDQGGI